MRPNLRLAFAAVLLAILGGAGILRATADEHDDAEEAAAQTAAGDARRAAKWAEEAANAGTGAPLPELSPPPPMWETAEALRRSSDPTQDILSPFKPTRSDLVALVDILRSELRRRDLERLAGDLGLDHRLIWAGERSDVAAAMSALDLHTSASLFGEGFSNAVAEAMAAGVPCVVTEVGDSRLIVGDCGAVVPPNDVEALARGWAQLLDQETDARRDLAVRCRARIVAEFSLVSMVARTESLYRELVGDSPSVPITAAGAA